MQKCEFVILFLLCGIPKVQNCYRLTEQVYSFIIVTLVNWQHPTE
jgi:hypothetical protein